MKFPFSHMAGICPERDPRPVLKLLHYNAEFRRLEATDGRIMCVIWVDGAEEDTESFYVPPALLTAAMSYLESTPSMISSEVEAELYFSAGQVTLKVGDAIFSCPAVAEAELGKYPDCDKVMELVGPEKGQIEMCLDLALLGRLGDALFGPGAGMRRVALRFTGPTRPIGVIPLGDDAGVSRRTGVIMPIKVG